MEPRFTPQMFIEYDRATREITIQDLGVAPTLVLSWGHTVCQAMAEAIGAQLSQHWIYRERHPLYFGQINGRPVSIAHLPVGAPGTVMMMEEMIACGARLFLGLGWAGSLQPKAPIGSFIIPTYCLREEGTSFHYLDGTATIGYSARLVERLRATCEQQGATVHAGQLWTTDAPYRETLKKIEAYRARGVLGVDMETAAMYALGYVRGVEVCNLLVVSDELWHEWRPAFGTDELRAATTRAQQVLLAVLAEGLE